MSSEAAGRRRECQDEEDDSRGVRVRGVCCSRSNGRAGDLDPDPYATFSTFALKPLHGNFITLRFQETSTNTLKFLKRCQVNPDKTR